MGVCLDTTILIIFIQKGRSIEEVSTPDMVCWNGVNNPYWECVPNTNGECREKHVRRR